MFKKLIKAIVETVLVLSATILFCLILLSPLLIVGIIVGLCERGYQVEVFSTIGSILFIVMVVNNYRQIR